MADTDLCHCGHVYDEHEHGAECSVCNCTHFEKAGDDDEPELVFD